MQSKPLQIVLIIFISVTLIALLGYVYYSQNEGGSDHKEEIQSEVETPLMWEDNDRFQNIRDKLNVKQRMSVYKTVLPDPLPGEEDNIALAADILSGTIVKSGDTFSLINTIGPFTTEKGYKKGPSYRNDKIKMTMGGGVCKIASTLYNNVILANLKVIERHAHSMPVPYVPPGQDATISYTGNKDFKFKNNAENPVLIQADTKGTTLYMAIYGSNKPPVVNWGHKIIDKVKYKTIYRNNPSLAKGEKKEIIPGADGLTVKSWVDIMYDTGEENRKELGIDKYSPINKVVEKN